jgi:hypothetical protein
MMQDQYPGQQYWEEVNDQPQKSLTGALAMPRNIIPSGKWPQQA